MLRAPIFQRNVQIIKEEEQQFEASNDAETEQQAHHTTKHTYTLVPRYSLFVNLPLLLQVLEADAKSNNISPDVVLYLHFGLVPPVGRTFENFVYKIVADTQPGGEQLVSDGFTLYGAAVTVCFGGRFERTLDFGDVADSNIPNVGGELVIDTTTLIDNVL